MIELALGDIAVTVDDEQGARLASLRVGDAELLVTRPEPSNGAADPLGWGCYAMAPFAGRIRDGVLRWNGEDHQLPTNRLSDDPHAIHGTVLDEAWETIEVDAAYARLWADLGPDWPWPGRCIQEVTVADRSIVVRLEVHADGDPFPATCGLHPWFAGATIGDRAPAQAMYVRDDSGIPTGDLAKPTPGPWDDCFTGVRWPIEVRFASGVVLDVAATSDHVVLYTEPEYAVCVEPQTGPPDAPALAQAAIVRPGYPLLLDVTFTVRAG